MPNRVADHTSDHTPDDTSGQTADETAVVVTAAAAVPPEQVWHTLVDRTDEWWGAPYLPANADPMRLEARLGGRVWSGAADASAGDLHGVIRAFDPPERLEIGGVLVPGAYAGSIMVTIDRTRFGSDIRVEQMARGRLEATVEERISDGWSRLLAALTALADE